MTGRRVRLVTSLALLASSALSSCGSTAPWTELFDGRTLRGWEKTEFGGEGEVTVEGGRLVLAPGEPLTGITWRGDAVATTNYEVEFSGARMGGPDFFAALTFPVGQSHCTLVLGGWGGVVVGLSNVDGYDADNNPTKRFFDFTEGRFYVVRVRVTDDHISAWIDGERMVHQARRGHEFALRAEVIPSQPFGLASFQTEGAFTTIRWRRLR